MTRVQFRPLTRHPSNDSSSHINSERRYIDDYADAPGTKSWEDLAIEPDLLEEVAIVYLRRYRSKCVLLANISQLDFAALR